MFDHFSKKLIMALQGLNQNTFKSMLMWIDAIWQRIVGGFSVEEYFYTLKLYQIPIEQRSGYISNKKASELEEQMNGGRLESFDNKGVFLAKNGKLIRRDWVLVEENNSTAFFDFIQKHPRFLDKPNKGSFGQEIIIRDTSSYDNNKKEQLFRRSKGRLLEEIVLGCKELQCFHPSSLNTIRVITFNNHKEGPTLLYSFLKLGRGESIVDNCHSNGLCIMINQQNGCTYGKAYSSDGKLYHVHPDTGIAVSDLIIPCWQKIVDFSQKCALMNPEAVIAGWDIALNENYEPILIEGNCTPNLDLIQTGLRRGVKNELLELRYSVRK